MKKILAILFVGFILPVFAYAEAEPYFFSKDLKKAISKCKPYSEDLFEKNPAMREEPAKVFSMFADKINPDTFKFLLEVKGKKDDKCQISMSYDYKVTKQEFNCELNKEAQKKLLNAMKDKSTQIKTKNFEKSSVTGRDFDITIAEIRNNSCKIIEQKSVQTKEKEKAYQRLAFSEKFKKSLKNCTPDTDTIKVNGVELNKVKIKGKEKGKCHVVFQGFHILLSDNELSVSGFDELGDLLLDENRASYSPSYKYQGTLFGLSKCYQAKNNKGIDMDFGANNENISVNHSIKITRGVDSSYIGDSCQMLFSLKMKRNGKEQDYSLRCVVKENQLSQYLQPYNNLLLQYGPKVSKTNNVSSFSKGKQTEAVSKADQNLFLKMYKAGICKK